MLYTRKGDDGMTGDFKSGSSRKSKASSQIEALGALDELNSFLGLVKIRAKNISWKVDNKKVTQIIFWIQNCLFTIQAEVAGADKKIMKDRVIVLEEMIDWIEKELPPIRTFFISGGAELAVLSDISRTFARKVERRVINVVEKKEIQVSPNTLVFLNRLSSLFYALARLSNHKSGIKEVSPDYK